MGEKRERETKRKKEYSIKKKLKQENGIKGRGSATTLCIMTFSITALSITTLCIMTFSITALSITALSITALSNTALSITIKM
jgi:hypothetical protein